METIRTASELQSLLRQELGDPNGTTYDNEGQLLQALEYAQNEIIMNFDFRFLRDRATEDLVSGTYSYYFPEANTVTGAKVSDVLFDRIDWIKIKDSDASTAVFRRLNKIPYDQWHKFFYETVTPQTGTPYWYAYNDDSQSIVIYPIPDYSVTSGILYEYQKKPHHLTNGGDAQMAIPNEYEELLIVSAAARIKRMEEDYDASDFLSSKAKELRSLLKAQSRETNDCRERIVFSKRGIYSLYDDIEEL
jgi:hypothetical protein